MDDPTPAIQSDSELLTEFTQRRSEPAFAEVVRRHGGLVLSVCRSVLGNTPDAEDAAQAVFLTLGLKAKSRSVRAHVVGWLHRVAWYVAARAAKARAIRRRHEQEATRMRPETVDTPGVEPIQMDLLHAALTRLSEKYRVPLILHHLEGRSHAETAALLGCSVEAIAVRLHRARDMLRQRLDHRGVVASAAALGSAWGSQSAAQASSVFVTTTSHAAVSALAGNLAASAAVSGQSLALTQGAIKMLYWAKAKVIVASLATVLTVGAVVGTVLHANQPAAAGVAAGGAGGALLAAAPTAVTGVITKVEDGQVTLMRRTGSVTVAIDKATVIKVNDAAAAADALKVGMNAAAFAEDGKPATEIRAYSPKPKQKPMAEPQQAVTGLISEVGATSITVQRRNVPSVSVALNSETSVEIDERAATISDLKAGMSVGVFFTPGEPASTIDAFTNGGPARR